MTEKEWEDYWRRLERQADNTDKQIQHNRNRNALRRSIIDVFVQPGAIAIILALIIILAY